MAIEREEPIGLTPVTNLDQRKVGDVLPVGDIGAVPALVLAGIEMGLDKTVAVILRHFDAERDIPSLLNPLYTKGVCISCRTERNMPQVTYQIEKWAIEHGLDPVFVLQSQPYRSRVKNLIPTGMPEKNITVVVDNTASPEEIINESVLAYKVFHKPEPGYPEGLPFIILIRNFVDVDVKKGAATRDPRILHLAVAHTEARMRKIPHAPWFIHFDRLQRYHSDGPRTVGSVKQFFIDGLPDERLFDAAILDEV